MEVLNYTPKDWLENEEKCLKLLEEDNVLHAIPSLNNIDHVRIDGEKLVKFRGMIQDMNGPEFYLEKLETTNPSTGEKTIKFGKYSDSNEFDANDFNDATKNERHLFIVISTPAVNPWVKTIEDKKNHIIVTSEPSTSSNIKRPIDDMVEIVTNTKKVCLDNTEQSNNSGNIDRNKENCDDTDWSNYPPKELLNNLPIPDRNAKVCLLLAYKEFDNLTINTVYDFIGFIGSTCNQIITGPQSSIYSIPRLHCVKFDKVTHCNPLIDSKLVMSRMETIRKELLIILTQLLCGDELAAEYLLYNLISNVYMRRNEMALGKFCLNISNIPKLDNLDYVETIYKFIELFTTKSHYFSMSLDNLNNMQFIAKKDYATNILKTSLLQLSPNTHLVLDETKLSTGQLNENGLKNIRAIDNTIKFQKSIFDFVYYQLEFDCDIVFLIFSEGKSMLSSDCHVVLNPETVHINTFKEITEAATYFLKPELLDQIRTYLSKARLINYEIPEDISELIQNEYVEMRQKWKLTGDDLHQLLVLARLDAISQGKSLLDHDSWKRACNLEETRRQRLSTK